MMVDDSKEEKSGAEMGNCAKGSRMGKPVPPPEGDVLPNLPESSRGTL